MQLTLAVALATIINGASGYYYRGTRYDLQICILSKADLALRQIGKYNKVKKKQKKHQERFFSFLSKQKANPQFTPDVSAFQSAPIQQRTNYIPF